ncbi:MAG: enoyl-CoA hydratase/isomerase family protein [Deltaproteobacteria bacterium]|nr:enoyl-CoA hydratase/isomerase family protein [Deltaproteobacteria bacterium]
MSGNVVLVDKKGFVATLVLNRPERKNSLNPAMLLKIAEYLNEFSRDDNIRAVVIRGEGGKAFSSGYDITEIPKDIPDELVEELKGKNPLEIGLDAIESYPYPVIAMIDGYALGAGCELAVTCDIRVAADTSKMGVPPSRLGVVYHPSGIQKFINVIGLANAKEVFFTGRYYDIEKAKEMGMVNYVVPKAEIYSFTYNLAEEIAGNAPLSLKSHKYIFNKLLHYQGVREEDQGEIEKMIIDAFNSDDLKEGAAAFFQKRKPVFKGR